jgi:hypothetical protein
MSAEHSYKFARTDFTKTGFAATGPEQSEAPVAQGSLSLGPIPSGSLLTRLHPNAPLAPTGPPVDLRPGDLGARRGAGPVAVSARIALSLIEPNRSVIAATPHYRLSANNKTVHWGYFSKSLAPALTVRLGDTVTIEILTHRADDDFERMVKGNVSGESVFRSTPRKRHRSRGASAAASHRRPAHRRRSLPASSNRG